MQPIPFIATNAEEAVAQIREKLGPEAIVLNVRPLPANGIARLWQKPMIEVLAYRPEPAAQATLSAAPQTSEPISDTLAEFRQQLDELRQKVVSRNESTAITLETEVPAPAAVEITDLKSSNWRVGAMLQKSGLLPLHAQKILDALRAKHGDNPPTTLAEEIVLTRKVMSRFWRKPTPVAPHSFHVLVGPSGSGKTTCLSKWLTQTSLMEGKLARVWRLDGATANMAESLTVYCDIVGARHERLWEGPCSLAEDIGFIDLPGVDWRNPLAVKELGGHLKQFGSPRAHLVLNGAYETSVLLAQARAFSELPIDSLIVTHLDEETRWGKIWNLALGTSYPIRHFSTGQNIPGDYREATAEMLLSRQFPANTAFNEDPKLSDTGWQRIC